MSLKLLVAGGEGIHDVPNTSPFSLMTCYKILKVTLKKYGKISRKRPVEDLSNPGLYQ
jgi:hypothetical protein